MSALDQPIPTNSPTANWKRSRRLGWRSSRQREPGATRAELLRHVDKVKEHRRAHCALRSDRRGSPQGDVAAADALDKIVATDARSGEPELVATDNTVAQVAWRFARARAIDPRWFADAMIRLEVTGVSRRVRAMNRPRT